jgi:hypothetical protein
MAAVRFSDPIEPMALQNMRENGGRLRFSSRGHRGPSDFLNRLNRKQSRQTT